MQQTHPNLEKSYCAIPHKHSMKSPNTVAARLCKRPEIAGEVEHHDRVRAASHGGPRQEQRRQGFGTWDDEACRSVSATSSQHCCSKIKKGRRSKHEMVYARTTKSISASCHEAHYYRRHNTQYYQAASNHVITSAFRRQCLHYRFSHFEFIEMFSYFLEVTSFYASIYCFSIFAFPSRNNDLFSYR